LDQRVRVMLAMLLERRRGSEVGVAGEMVVG
jgi:hypothetical protein